MTRPSYRVTRLDYDLPPDRIAQHPASERTASRMIYVNVPEYRFEDLYFDELPYLLSPETLIVLNDSKVIPARILGKRPVNEEGQGGGRVEVLFHRYMGEGVSEAVVGSSASLAEEEVVLLPGGWTCELLEKKQLGTTKVCYLRPDGEVADLDELMSYLNQHGITPLPPYIAREEQDQDLTSRLAVKDRERYQTVYARHPGSVAAPTAGLHFDEPLLAKLSGQHMLRSVTLHVGLGTFAPIRAIDLAEHRMHTEAFSVYPDFAGEYFSRLKQGLPILAVGTTSLRVLHSLREGVHDVSQAEGPIHGITDAFIYPGRDTKAADMLLTNFHLPRSTLLALVYSFGGETLMRKVYEHAVEGDYRFFSYGDCMLIDRRKST
ncbi:tRNA preQ1(34) S-adenosylmethionine ribosyltransferase-isomerase QueA [bacterium]|nr:tRNA preQ1(34) S-adenosylmethionine ribosyltransferase-isomerase QueA [bacterium]